VPLEPQLHEGTFVFVSVPHGVDVAGLDVVATMSEDEGLTLVLSEEQAEARGLPVLLRVAWITLSTATDLGAVGITAAFSRALAEVGIACNVIAGAFHDHVFVPVDRADQAIAVLRNLP